jgi:xanthine dehydrogenase large subunit
VTGAAKYVDDLAMTMLGCAHAWPVTAPHMHAKVMRIDGTAALAAPGVLTLLTAADVTGENDVGPARHDEPLFPSEVCFHGQAVAWVVAETEAQAREAASRVNVLYEPLPAIATIEQAIAAEAFLTEREVLRRGKPDEALAQAPQRLRGELHVGGQEHFYLETQAALAYTDESDCMFVHSSTQHPTETQEIVARVLGTAKADVVVQCLRMGGAFGGKETQANTWAAVAALAARKLKRAVRVRLTRSSSSATADTAST